MKAGWQAESLKSVAEIGPKKSEARALLAEADLVSFVPMDCLNVDEITLSKHESRPLAEVYSGYTYFKDGDVLLAKITPCFENGKLGIAGGLKNGVGFGSSEFVVVRPTKSLSAKYLYYFLNRECFRKEVKPRMAGAVGHKRVPKELLEELVIPLPPLEEQRRIVAILDEAFEGLSRARANAEANLQSARELFEASLTDMLTHGGRNWQESELGALCEKITVGHVGPMADRYVEKGTTFLRSQNIKPFRVDLSDVKYIDAQFTSELRKSELQPGDVAIVRTGYPGTSAVIPNDLPIANCADLVIARTGSKLNPHFLAMLLNSQYGKSLVAKASVGAAQKHFNVSAAKKAVFSIPPLEIQEKLVARTKELSLVSDALADAATGKIQSLDNLRQSLLNKAFAGELTVKEFA